ncbi:non-ribosomal peptide synthetase [Amycolatopsis keratiniphila]|uniref:Amino acid adenylation domain-containing protein n=1 Tax=Amycolatopsis keratiniphila TaxID=129921 RepID=R4SZH4_9PSEU|nr:non-ribosomal peptide synthetase [Amycolatopsis keratiniphila]AGM07930.1 amino acid adenylation domain-containing protein [Amycolatopsis keratiniphila]
MASLMTDSSQKMAIESHAAAAVYFADRWLARPGIWHGSVGLMLEGLVQPDRLGARATAVVARHPALRTSIVFDENGVSTRTHMSAEVDFDVRDVTSLPVVEVDRLVAEDCAAPFDLAAGPATRCRLYRLGDQRHLLVVTAHRAVCDMGSLRLVAAGIAGGEDTVGPVAEDVGADRQDPDAVAFRRRTLVGAADEIVWTTDRPRPPRRRGLGGVVRRVIAPATADRLAEFAAAVGGSEEAVLLIALRVLVLRHTRQGDVLIGLWADGRPADDAVGVFEDLVPLRNPLSLALTPREAIRAEAWERASALAQRIPYFTLTEGFRHNRSTPLPGMVQVVFGHRKASPDPAPAARWHALAHQAFPFDLGLDVCRGEETVVTWSYDDDFLDAGMVSALADRFAVLLDQMLAEPDRAIADTPWLTEADRTALPASSSQGAAPCVPVVDRVDEWVKATPEAVAVRQHEETLTYSELSTFAGRVSAWLAALDFPRQARIGLLMDRSVDVVPVILGIAKAGFVCVPMDPTHPSARLAHVVADAGVRLILTDRHDGLISTGVPVQRVSDLPDVAGGALTEPHPDDLAYVLYTSGSTGLPKGVEVTLGGLANCLRATGADLDYRPGERLLAVSTIAFDIAMLELLLPVTHGGETILSTSDESRDGERLRAALDGYRPRYLQGTPMTWQMLLFCGWPGDPGLVAMCGGDLVSPALAGRLLASCHSFWHTYGPTETTLYTLSARLRPGPQPHVLSVGKPIDGTSVSIVDEIGRDVAPGVVGELCVGGAGVARGYTGRRAETAARFVPDPGMGGGARRYRTGDLARFRPDGAVELHGRGDRQVKIRGQRIELGEIETVLQGCAGVAAAAVIVAGAGEERSIVAFLQPERSELSPREMVARVGAHARDRLPRYMVPASWATVAALPLGPNGKIDRARLARATPPRRTGEYLMRPEDIEVSAIWAEVLGRAAIPAEAVFPDLGGDVVAASRVLEHVSLRFGVRLSLADFVEEPTVRTLADRIRRAKVLAAAGAQPRDHDLRHSALLLVAAKGQTDGVLAAMEPSRVTRMCAADTVWTEAVGLLAGFGARMVVAGWGDEAVPALETAIRLREEFGCTVPVVAVRPGPLPAHVAARAGGPVFVVDTSLRAMTSSWDRIPGGAGPVLLPGGADDDLRLAGLLAVAG